MFLAVVLRWAAGKIEWKKERFHEKLKVMNLKAQQQITPKPTYYLQFFVQSDVTLNFSCSTSFPLSMTPNIKRSRSYITTV
ncbi:hypothetical protein Ctha_0927 [Chloroherpeton thalassium ATCC 35110]|uniref:Uncharacterized protein n=1 Tax=Chloroherpeton thalassium (strain ATCC 35110 / GB-78) TaxID=517418 RepID=B3QXB8_CHLT3|nr:hypothetical protein Ctha_0927 [Chloroherpeton thalassium ATCC 35110]